MTSFLTTEETAAYLRLSERKLYELVAAGAIPCTKITGRWLFPREAIDRWVMAGLITSPIPAQSPPPPIVGGGQDALLDWALRESGSGLASLPESGEAGLQRLVNGEVLAAAIHLHRLDGDDESANADSVAQMQGLHDGVVIAFARRQQGIVVAAGNPLGLSDIESVVQKRARIAQGPSGTGAQLLLSALIARASIQAARLIIAKPVYPTDLDVAQAIRAGRADCGIAPPLVARAAALDFLPLAWEYFDLVFRQRNYFSPRAQSLLKFMRSDKFRDRAAELGGYEVNNAGDVRWA